MAKARTGQVKRQGRRAIPAVRRKGAQLARAAKKATLTLGDLVAAAFDTVGSKRDVAKVLSSAELAAAIQRRIVLV